MTVKYRFSTQFGKLKSGSGDIFDNVTRSSDRYEFENDLSVSEVKNLPDKLPPIDRSNMPASRLEKMYVRREARHTRQGSSTVRFGCDYFVGY